MQKLDSEIFILFHFACFSSFLNLLLRGENNSKQSDEFQAIMFMAIVKLYERLHEENKVRCVRAQGVTVPGNIVSVSFVESLVQSRCQKSSA